MSFSVRSAIQAAHCVDIIWFRIAPRSTSWPALAEGISGSMLSRCLGLDIQDASHFALALEPLQIVQLRCRISLLESYAKDDVSNVSLIEAWRIWLSGDLPDSTLLWGISILWWERIGKLMQVTGAATIIADIIGPEEIRRFGTSLQSQVTSTTLIQFLRQCFNWYVIIFRQTILKDFIEDTDRAPQQNYSQLNFLNSLICFLATIIIAYGAELYRASWSVLLIDFVIIFGCLLISISPLLTVLTVIGLTVLGLAVNTLVLQPIAWFLEHPSLDRHTKIASLLLLLIGFHFEMLAS